MSIESLLLADREHLYRQSVGIRRAAEMRLSRGIETVETEFHYETMGLVFSGDIEEYPLEFKRTHDEDILFYLKFPYLFYELYAQVPLQQYDQLAISQYLYLSHVLMLDRLMDGKLLLEPQIAYWTNSTYQKIIATLSELFPTDSPFWIYFEKCRIENAQALTLERIQHTYRISEYSEQEKIFIFSGKSAMAKAGLAALAYLSRQDVSEEIALSCEAFHIGLQLLDNLQDWRSDYRDHLYTPLLTRVLLDHQLADEVESTRRPDVNAVGSLIYGQGHALATLKDAMEAFRLALYVVRDVNCPAWQNEILSMIQGCEQYSAALEQKLLNIQAKRKSQTPKPAAQANLQPAQQDIPILTIPSSQQPSAAWVADFCQAAHVDPDAFRECADLAGDPAIFIQAACDVLECCKGDVPAPEGLQLYLCNNPQVPASMCFEHEQKWQIVLNLAHLSDDTRQHLQLYREHAAYQYGRMSRFRYMKMPQTFLDEMCVKGFGLLFVVRALPAAKQLNLLPKDMHWFERNKHYLWQEIQPYLGSPAACHVADSTHFYGLDALLGYDLISSYCERMGTEALSRGVQVTTEDILNKSTVLTVANRIAGATSVRVDL
ncbi:MAG: hypothetical protein WCC12_15775 [Anaerolineales bacterium]